MQDVGVIVFRQIWGLRMGLVAIDRQIDWTLRYVRRVL
jgi:hypothetical protein